MVKYTRFLLLLSIVLVPSIQLLDDSKTKLTKSYSWREFLRRKDISLQGHLFPYKAFDFHDVTGDEFLEIVVAVVEGVFLTKTPTPEMFSLASRQEMFVGVRPTVSDSTVKWVAPSLHSK